jgi:hypothetical protein
VSTEPSWGEPPVPDVLARLLRERHGLSASDRVSVEPVDRGLSLELRSSGRCVRFELTYLRGAGPSEDPWDRIVDALDALFGQYLESGRDHRSLPTGDDVEHAGAFFRVRVESTVPELEKIADHMLRSH